MALIREHRLIRLLREADIYTTRELAAALAESNGFDTYQSADIETAVSELCSNALKYGDRGWAVLRGRRGEFEAVITDEGPGFGMASKVKRGLGVGLPGVKRLMDDMLVDRVAGQTRVCIKKHLATADPLTERDDQWEVNVASRLRVGRRISGDTWWVSPADPPLLTAVVDGLGSGEKAAEASAAVIGAISAHDPADPLDRMMRNAHEAARATRGAVGLVARVDRSGLEYCGVGDVGGRIEPTGETLMPNPGVLGVEVSDLVPKVLPWPSGSTLALWTDGLKPPLDVLSRGPDYDQIEDWLDQVALEHGVERDDGLLVIATDSGRTGTRNDL